MSDLPPYERLVDVLQAVDSGTALLIGTCVACEHWFPVDDFGESCPADATEHRTHPVNYYVLCGVRRD